VVAGLATLVAALLLTVLLAGRATPSPNTSAIAGAEAWAMIEHLFHADAGTPGTSGGVLPDVPATPPSIAAGDSAVAQLPRAAAVAPAGDRFAAIDRHAQAPRPATTAAPRPAPVVAPPVASAPAPAPAPLPVPAPVAPAASLLDAVTSLVAHLLGLLTGG
jgi:hypothetical protein